MRRSRAIAGPVSLFLLTMLVLAGCMTSKDAASEEANAAEGYQDNSVHVLIDGQDKGVLPATVRVRRSFGTRMVSLYQGGKEIRTFELTKNYTVEDIQLAYSFFGRPQTGEMVYDVSVLPKDSENEYFIPFSRYPIRIEDREYDLVLLVTE